MKIAINGFGRIGRIFFRQVINETQFEVKAINDLTSPENLLYLLKYDSVYGRFEKEVELKGSKFIIDNKEILIFNEKDPQNLPWKDLDIDVVVEATGIFTEREKAKAHLQAGAKVVVLTAPPKDDTLTLTPYLGDWDKIQTFSLGDIITSNASCTTNSVNPVIAILDKRLGVLKAILTTIHAYTNTQSLVDSVTKGSDFRRGRAGAFNIIPSTTGAAEAVIKVLPFLKDKFDGLSIRVPVIGGSLSDITMVVKRKTSVEEVNSIIEEEVQANWQKIVKVIKEPVVSSDILKEPYGALIDLTLTKVVDGDLVKVFSWYDNEWGYCAMLKLHLLKIKDLIFK